MAAQDRKAGRDIKQGTEKQGDQGMSKEGIRNKQRPFRLLRYLFENTDEEHPVTTSELVEIFQAEDAHASRKTVKDDIDILVKEGFDIITVRSTQNSFFLGSRSLEVPELKHAEFVFLGKPKPGSSRAQAADRCSILLPFYL